MTVQGSESLVGGGARSGKLVYQNGMLFPVKDSKGNNSTITINDSNKDNYSFSDTYKAVLDQWVAETLAQLPGATYENLKDRQFQYGLFLWLDLARARLAGARLNNVIFVNCNFDGADLSGVSFQETLFINSSFNNTDFSRASLHKAVFLGATSTAGAILTNATWNVETVGIQENFSVEQISQMSAKLNTKFMPRGNARSAGNVGKCGCFT